MKLTISTLLFQTRNKGLVATTLLVGAVTASASRLGMDSINIKHHALEHDRQSERDSLKHAAFPFGGNLVERNSPKISSESCPFITEVKCCGDRVTNRTVVLGQDLIFDCDELTQLYNNKIFSLACSNNSLYSNTALHGRDCNGWTRRTVGLQ